MEDELEHMLRDGGASDVWHTAALPMLGMMAYAYGKGQQLMDKETEPVKTTEEYESELEKYKDQLELARQVILDTATALSEAKRGLAAAQERARIEKLRTDAVETSLSDQLVKNVQATGKANAEASKLRGDLSAAYTTIKELRAQQKPVEGSTTIYNPGSEGQTGQTVSGSRSSIEAPPPPEKP